MSKSKILSLLAFLVVVAFALWLASGRLVQGKVRFRAESSFVLCDSTVSTNAAGEIVFPQRRSETGTYQDLGLIVNDGIKPLLCGGSRAKTILNSYLQSKSRVNAPVHSITSAFETAEYRLVDGSRGIVQLVVVAESRELAIDINRCVLTNYIKSVERANLSIEGKALAKLKWDIQKKREAHEDVPELLGELERAKGVVKNHYKKVIVTSQPHIVESPVTCADR